MSDTTERRPGQATPGRVIPTPPIHPPVFPPPVTFDFSVPSMTVKNPRALETDTDFATIAIATLAPDDTEIAKYGPTSRYLGNLGKGQTIDPGMSLTGVEVPDGGSVAFTFLVVNRGAWIGDNQALEDISLVGATVLGALVQGQILGVTSIADSIGFWPALAVAAAVLTAIEGLNILLADCDGVVVSGAMKIGKTELLSGAATQAWETPVDYPGTDSPVGCGANSDYTVTYAVGPTPPMVATPSVIGLLPKEAAEQLRTAGLNPVEETVKGDLDPGIVSAQSPAAGMMVPVGSTVEYTVHYLGPGGHPD